ncbi:MAG: phosphodiester glycosidase family protein [Ruminococcaceae bacterium]|nr:phosphodiester glycosidase family protein [Oscillospiraceae bacterium]
MKRIISLALCILMCASLIIGLCITPLGAEEGQTITGEASRASQEITLSNGQKTGVTWTQIELDGYYGNDRLVNVAEFNLSNTNLSIEVINSGKSIVSVQTLDQAVQAYNESHKGQTVLAAVNGDLWMTKVHSSSSLTSKTLMVTRGVLMIDGEIWASQQIDQENLDATNAEKGTPAGDKACFGITDRNQPLVGSPDINITMTVNGQTIEADGLNRLPARNAIIVYNHRVHSTNYALNDAYEVELEVDKTSAFTAGGTLSAKVVAIYKEGAVTRPALDNPDTIVLTARGNKVSTLVENFKVGDQVTFSTELVDRWGNTELWQNVQDAMGGHMPPILNGKPAVANSDSTAYPAALIGYKDDGSVMLVSVTSEIEGSRAGLKFSQSYDFCKEMGYNSVFYLDGGGSCTFLTLEEGSYTIRHQCSDGAPRAVINGIGVVWNDTPVCKKQGSLSYIKVPIDLSEIPPTYMDGALLSDLVGGPNAVSLSYDETEKAFKMTTSTKTNDPYATLGFNLLKRVNAEDYPYLVFKVKTDHPNNTNFVLFYACGNDMGADGARTKTFQVKKGTDDWQYIIVDMSKVSKWKGTINNIRLDIFDSVYTEADVSLYIGAIVLCPSLADATNVEAQGWAPEGSVTDYLQYIKDHTPEAPTEEPTEEPTEPPVEIPTEAPVITEAPTEAPATDPETDPIITEAPTEAPTSAATQAPAQNSGSCGSVISLSALALMSTLGGILLLKRKKR